jgi:plastocyanin
VFTKFKTLSRPRRWVTVLAPLAAATALSAIPLAASQAATPAVMTAAMAAAPARPAAGLPVMTVTMNGTSISVGGTLKSGAERVVFKVTGEPAGGPGFARLDPGATLSQLFAALPAASQDPNNLYGIAQVVMSTQANKGTSSVYLNLTPGTYVAIDLASTAKTPPVTVFTVTRSYHPAAMPKAGATISTREFGFTGASTISDGETVQWANAGFLVHMIQGIEAPNLATANKIAADLKAGNDNAAQALATGEYGWDGALSHGQSFESVVSQTPGYWVIACFMDTQDGREHTTLGMEKVIHIVK